MENLGSAGEKGKRLISVFHRAVPAPLSGLRGLNFRVCSGWGFFVAWPVTQKVKAEKWECPLLTGSHLDKLKQALWLSCSGYIH